jgi:hypothetical protein
MLEGPAGWCRETTACPSVDLQGEGRVPDLVWRDAPHRISHQGIAGRGRLSEANERAKHLADTPLDDVLERDDFQLTNELLGNHRLPSSCSVPRGECTDDASVAHLVACRSSSRANQSFWRPMGSELAAQPSKRSHRNSFELGHLGEMLGERGSAAGARRFNAARSTSDAIRRARDQRIAAVVEWFAGGPARPRRRAQHRTDLDTKWATVGRGVDQRKPAFVEGEHRGRGLRYAASAAAAPGAP